MDAGNWILDSGFGIHDSGFKRIQDSRGFRIQEDSRFTIYDSPFGTVLSSLSRMTSIEHHVNAGRTQKQRSMVTTKP